MEHFFYLKFIARSRIISAVEVQDIPFKTFAHRATDSDRVKSKARYKVDD